MTCQCSEVATLPLGMRLAQDSTGCAPYRVVALRWSDSLTVESRAWQRPQGEADPATGRWRRSDPVPTAQHDLPHITAPHGQGIVALQLRNSAASHIPADDTADTAAQQHLLCPSHSCTPFAAAGIGTNVNVCKSLDVLSKSKNIASLTRKFLHAQ